ncbi:hypothetical protein UVI_02047270 [Ustilaginoidea virens]|uniref:Uncharacterized protein n=1 Tax=Ustilaginoidea virens TaxID=1159556 RepID=A0A1B5L2E5_USTVR|nr:hypothetical protein UVI_02047270 [Ustilaginoidea virens]
MLLAWGGRHGSAVDDQVNQVGTGLPRRVNCVCLLVRGPAGSLVLVKQVLRTWLLVELRWYWAPTPRPLRRDPYAERLWSGLVHVWSVMSGLSCLVCHVWSGLVSSGLLWSRWSPGAFSRGQRSALDNAKPGPAIVGPKSPGRAATDRASYNARRKTQDAAKYKTRQTRNPIQSPARRAISTPVTTRIRRPSSVVRRPPGLVLSCLVLPPPWPEEPNAGQDPWGLAGAFRGLASSCFCFCFCFCFCLALQPSAACLLPSCPGHQGRQPGQRIRVQVA